MLNIFKFLSVVLVLKLSPGYTSECPRSYKPCRNSCNAYSAGIEKWKDTVSIINCSVQSQVCGDVVSEYSPGSPRNIFEIDVLRWCLVRDPTEDHDRIALNITWSPSAVSDIKYQTGFKLSITNINSRKTTSLFYCMDHNLSYAQHAQSIFYYDCFGLGNSTYIRPEDKFEVSIRSLPGSVLLPSQNRADFDLKSSITIPDCRDPQLYNVWECVVLRDLQIHIVNLYCANRTIEFQYSVPRDYGNTSNLLLCQGEENQFNHCLSQVAYWQKVRLKARTWYQIPKQYFLQRHNYTLYVWGSLQNQKVAKTSFNFTNCGESLDLSTHIIVISILIGVLFVAVCALVYRSRQKKCKALNKNKTSTLQRESCLKKTNQSTIIYIVYSDDHPKHKEVVLNLATLLTSYGFHVIFELWEEEAIAQNCTGWMQKSKDRADKVIVIWSPGATIRWNNYKAASQANSSADASIVVPINDIFIPVVNQIYSDLFCRRNLGKYYFAFFDYGDENCIPVADFQHHVSQTFNIMKDLDDLLYFRLKNLEIHMPGSVLKSKARDDEARIQLEKSISEMRNLVSNCSDWYRIPREDPILHPDPESGIFLAENDSSFLTASTMPIADIQPLMERSRPVVEPVESVNSLANPYDQLMALNSIRSWV